MSDASVQGLDGISQGLFGGFKSQDVSVEEFLLGSVELDALVVVIDPCVVEVLKLFSICWYGVWYLRLLRRATSLSTSA